MNQPSRPALRGPRPTARARRAPAVPGEPIAPGGASPGRRRRAVQHGDLTWVDLQRPSGADIDWLHTQYPHFHPLHFVDVTRPFQHCKLDERDDYLFLVLRFPILDPQTRLTTASEVDLFVGPGYVVTAHAGQLRPLQGLFDQVCDIPATRAAVMSRGSGYVLYTILDRLVDYCFPMLTAIDEKIERIEGLIFTDNIRQNVLEISLVRRDILAFRHVIKPQIELVEDLEQRAAALAPVLGADLSDYFSHLNNRAAKIWHTVEAYKEVIEGLNDTHDSLINAHINIVIKVLTVFSVLLLPMTLISSIYGMNFSVLPLSNDPDGFWLAMAAMVVIAALMVVFFKWRRWV
jgi:magnesium transporter